MVDNWTVQRPGTYFDGLRFFLHFHPESVLKSTLTPYLFSVVERKKKRGLMRSKQANPSKSVSNTPIHLLQTPKKATSHKQVLHTAS